jgi:exosortase family protein XrtF
MGKIKELIFLFIRFFVSYGLMLFLYQNYLIKYNIKQNTIDPYTKQLSIQVSLLLDAIGMENSLVYFEKEKGVGFVLLNSGRCIGYINEGCNVVSIMIIFIAFALTFYSNLFKTLSYILFGLIFLYIANIMRIVFLNIVLYRFSNYSEIAHDIVFPVIIYGSVILLWIIWINFILSDKYKLR